MTADGRFTDTALRRRCCDQFAVVTGTAPPEILRGIAVIRAGVCHGWARPLMLIAGIFLLVPVTPALIVRRRGRRSR